MPDADPTSDPGLLDELETLRRQSVERCAEVKRLAGEIHAVLGRSAMIRALLADVRSNAAHVPGRLRHVARRARRPGR